MSKDKYSDYDSTAANNTDVGGVNIQGSASIANGDNALREQMSHTADHFASATISDSATPDLGANAAHDLIIDGTTTQTAYGTVKAGTVKFVTYSGARTLTHNATSFILPGAANITTAAGDTAIWKSLGSGNWRCLLFQRATAGWQPPVITPLVAYTPTFTGFGTATSISMWSRRVGDTLEIRGYFTTGTTTATEARISLGFNGTDSNVTSDATKVAAIQTANGFFIQAGASASLLVPLIESNVGYLTFGAQTGAAAGLTKQNGDAAFTSSRKYSFFASVPISGW